MSHAHGMRGCQGIGDLEGVPGHLAAAQPSAPGHFAERLSFRKLHGHKADPVSFGDLMNTRDVGVFQRGNGHRVVFESLHPDGIGGDSRMERLEDDFLGGLVVAGLVYDSSRVLPQPGMDGVVGYDSPDQGIGFGGT